MTLLVTLLRVAFEVLNWLIIARILMTWVPHNPRSPTFRFLFEITEPVLAPFRRLLPKGSMMDFSPIIAILVLQLVERLLVGILISL